MWVDKSTELDVSRADSEGETGTPTGPGKGPAVDGMAPREDKGLRHAGKDGMAGPGKMSRLEMEDQEEFRLRGTWKRTGAVRKGGEIRIDVSSLPQCYWGGCNNGTRVSWYSRRRSAPNAKKGIEYALGSTKGAADSASATTRHALKWLSRVGRCFSCFCATFSSDTRKSCSSAQPTPIGQEKQGHRRGRSQADRANQGAAACP